MSTPRPTPETDKFILSRSPNEAAWLTDHQWHEHARKLERERNEARKNLAAANKGAEINAHVNRSLAAKLAEARRERDEAHDQLEAMREAIKEVFNSFADEDSAWLLDDLQTAALTKLKPFIKLTHTA